MGIIRSPGKFEGELELCRVLYEMSMESDYDEEAGDASTGSAFLFRNLISSEAFSSESKDGVPEDFDEVKGDDNHVHAVLFERTDGFVECEFYDSTQEADKAFEKIARDLEPEGGDFEGRRGRGMEGLGQRNVRNFWIDGRVDGMSSPIQGGPKSAAGGFELVIFQRDQGRVTKALRLVGKALPNGRLVLDVENAETGETIHRVESRR